MWYIVKGVRKTFSLVVYRRFHQMNTKLSWTESNDYFSCHSDLKSWFSVHLLPGFQLEKNKGPRSSGRGHTRFLSRHVQRETGWLGIAGHPLAKDSLSWINCKRRQRGSTGSAFCGALGPSGGGLLSGWVCNEKLLPPTGPGLHSSLKPEAGNLCPRHQQVHVLWKPTTAFAFQPLGLRKPAP